MLQILRGYSYWDNSGTYCFHLPGIDRRLELEEHDVGNAHGQERRTSRRLTVKNEAQKEVR